MAYNAYCIYSLKKLNIKIRLLLDDGNGKIFVQKSPDPHRQ